MSTCSSRGLLYLFHQSTKLSSPCYVAASYHAVLCLAAQSCPTLCDPMAKLFAMVADVEKGHERILTQLHEELKAKTLYKCCEGEGCFKCDECGTVQTGKCAPTECPLCHQPQGYYRINITMNRK